MLQGVRFSFLLCFLLGVLNISLLYLWINYAHGFKHPHISNDISCYKTTKGDVLPYLDEEIMRRTNNIFFVETSCRGYLDPMQACAVESAVRTNPEYQVNVVFAGPVTNNTQTFLALQKLDVNMVRVTLNQILLGTPLERIVMKNLLHKSWAKVAHASDILRIFLLWKFGGVYLDLDFIVVKSLSKLKSDFAGVEENNVIATGAMGLSQSAIGRTMATELIEELGNSFELRRDSWSASGPGLLTKLLWDVCNTTELFSMSEQNCQGFKIYHTKAFYPISPRNYLSIYNPGDIDLKHTYAVHVWNKLISKYQRTIPENSLYAKLAKKYCPSVYKLFKSNFVI